MLEVELATPSVERSLCALCPAQGLHVPALFGCRSPHKGVRGSLFGTDLRGVSAPESGALDRACDRAVLSEVEQRILAEAVQPYPAPGISVADAHRDQPNVHASAVASMQRGGNDFTDDAHCNRAERILPAVLAGEHDL
jgi:hypothetical protein